MPIYEYKCQECGRIFSLLIRTDVQSQEPHCKHCDSIELKRLISRPSLVRTKTSAEAGQLRAVDPRRAVENMSRTYDQTGIDPGQGFEDVAKRAAAGDSPQELKEAVKEARKKEPKTAPKSVD
jgi:putative FmdB family regulatory protein